MGGKTTWVRRGVGGLALPLLIGFGLVVGLAGCSGTDSTDDADDADSSTTDPPAATGTETDADSAEDDTGAATDDETGNETDDQAGDDDGTVDREPAAVDADPGEALGRVEIEGQAERVVLAGDLVVVTGAELVALDRTTLEPVWQADLDSAIRGVGATGMLETPVMATTVAGRVVLMTADGDVAAEYAHPDLPWDVLVDDGVAWVGDGANRTMLRIDLADGTTSFVRGVDLPLRAVVVDDTVWVLGHENARLDPVSLDGQRLGGPILLATEPQLWPLTIDAGSGVLWAGPSDNRLWRADPVNEAVTEIEVPDADGRYLAVVEDRLWFVS
ncbi:MAG: PQQ-binding-like beta-propeller repeat protein, partial [Actinomycetota bacterium]